MKVRDSKKTPVQKGVVEQYQDAHVEISEEHNPDLKNLKVPKYTEEEHGTWKLMYERQEKALPGRASQEFLEALRMLNLPPDRIPRLIDISHTLERCTGWKLTRVSGLVPEKLFFELLSQKLFPCTDFIRKRSELEYTPSPDMFHDIFGHIPLITNPVFAEFYQYFGKTAVGATSEQIQKLQRIYWFTVEFGLIRNPEGIRIYGSGILSSPGEVFNALSSKVRVHPFDYKAVENQYYEIFHMQDDLFVIDSFEWLLQTFREYSKRAGLV